MPPVRRRAKRGAVVLPVRRREFRGALRLGGGPDRQPAHGQRVERFPRVMQEEVGDELVEGLTELHVPAAMRVATRHRPRRRSCASR